MPIPRSARGRNDDMPVYGGSRSRRDKDEDRPKPIGVPEDYTVRKPVDPIQERRRALFGRGAGRGGWRGRSRTLFGEGADFTRPRYRDGDEFSPAGLGPARIGELQAGMAAAGLLGDFRYGVWDDGTRKAYKNLLTEANAQGITDEAALNLRMQSFEGGGGGGGGGGGPGSGGGGGGGSWQVGPDGEPMWVEEQYVPPPLELRTTNKDDLRRVFRAAVIDTMGQGWSQAQLDELVDGYNWREIQVQKEAYDQTVAMERAEFMGERTEGGEVISTVDIASPETFLDQQLQEKDPVGYQTGKAVNEVIPDFFQMLDGWA